MKESEEKKEILSIRQWFFIILFAFLPIINIFYMYKIVFSSKEKLHYQYVKAQFVVIYGLFLICVTPVIFLMLLICFVS